MSNRSAEIRLRPARSDDREFFHFTRRAAFESYVDEIFGWHEDDQRARNDRQLDELPIQIIEEAGSPIGYLCVLHEEDHDFINGIALVPEAQGRGIGSRLIRDVIESASARGVCVRLSVLTNNPARHLYERLGFEVSRVEGPRIKMERSAPQGL